MSTIPSELRDAMVRKLERALDDRDRQISQAEGQVHSLRRAVGETEGILTRQRELLHQLENELHQAGRELDRERARALERLEELRRRAEEQHRRLEQALGEAERRHREEWEALQRQIQKLARDREEKERRTRQAAERAVERAAGMLARIDRDAVERLDLRGNLSAAEAQLEGARALLASRQAPTPELLTAAYGAEEAARQTEATLESRQATLDALSEQFLDDIAWLEALLRGDAMLDLPDQSGDLRLLLRPEQGQMTGLIDRQLRGPVARLDRWNGHGALVARLSAVRDLLGAEILTARKALSGAVEHEQARYDLSHIWERLELRFGTIRDRGGATSGAWADDGDRKSTYFYFLESQKGEIRVEVPWSSEILVHHEGRLVQRYPLAPELEGDVFLVGGLGRGWRELAARLDNPNWTPERPIQGGVR